MNTNTVEQGGRLSELKIIHPYRMQPALTLDDLHRVFDELYAFWPSPAKGFDDNDNIWEFNSFNRPFIRTKNHAEDWTAILIWLLENNHITSDQVNKALK